VTVNHPEYFSYGFASSATAAMTPNAFAGKQLMVRQ
jgi:hypothetical protein